MKKILVLILACLLFASCKGNQDNSSSYPKLKVENACSGSSDGFAITAVELVNYSFTPLDIKVGESRTFTLDKGMPGGYDDVLVVVHYGPSGAIRIYQIRKDFKDGDTTVVKIVGYQANGETIE